MHDYTNDGHNNDVLSENFLQYLRSRKNSYYEKWVSSTTLHYLEILQPKELYTEVFTRIEMDLVQHCKCLLPTKFTKKQIVIPMIKKRPLSWSQFSWWFLKWIERRLKGYETQMNYQIISFQDPFDSEICSFKYIDKERGYYSGLQKKMMQKIGVSNTIAPPHILTSRNKYSNSSKKNFLDENFFPAIMVSSGKVYNLLRFFFLDIIIYLISHS
jgi:hypothetical protein